MNNGRDAICEIKFWFWFGIAFSFWVRLVFMCCSALVIFNIIWKQVQYWIHAPLVCTTIVQWNRNALIQISYFSRFKEQPIQFGWESNRNISSADCLSLIYSVWHVLQIIYPAAVLGYFNFNASNRHRIITTVAYGLIFIVMINQNK